MDGRWAGRIDGGQAEYVRVPYADQGLDRIPSSVTDEQALLVGDVLATGYWAAQIGNIGPEDTVLIIVRDRRDYVRCNAHCSSIRAV